MSRRVGEVKAGDLVMGRGNAEVFEQQSGIVLEVKMVRYHSYLDQEQVATVLWEHGGTREVSSMSLRVLEDSPSSSLG